MDYNHALDTAIQRLHDEGRYRVFIDIEREKGAYPKAEWTRPDGRKQEITIWCGNDYLGMGQNPVVLAAMHEALDATGAGSGGTRNISGTTVYHKRLEAELADLHGKETALVFSSAYIANDATLSTLHKLFPGLIIYSDELNHASMIEGIKRNGGAKRIFRHNDVAHLRELLAADAPDAPKLIAFESVYSMDGDFGPITEICDLAMEFNALTYLDEVHAVGMY
ncbi:MAG: 5-aminolevulinate synthase, partial [Paracoccaceae bacterium]|nr:5-aminolevulinate synthase [Paracoccaceae bacterium]